MPNKKLIGETAIIVSDNENYKDFLGKELEITYASNSGAVYDKGVFPQMLCDFRVIESGDELPFSLYEYEFEIINLK